MRALVWALAVLSALVTFGLFLAAIWVTDNDLAGRLALTGVMNLFVAWVLGAVATFAGE